MLGTANAIGASAPAQQAEAENSSSSKEGRSAAQEDLRPVALKMRFEMPLKERIIHLQTFKYTFTGQQAVVFLLQQSLAGNRDAAADMCQRMLSQGLFKSIYHRDTFLPDGEVYRFSSSFPDGSKHKARIPGSITSTGLYKEIAKIGKTAAQPFKNIQLSLNDTLNSLGSLSIPAATKPGHLVSSLGGSRPRSSGSGVTRPIARRSQTGKLHVFADGAHGPPDSASSLANLVASMDALQANVKESTSLLRLDLQQHTALQEHLVGILMSQQDQMRVTQLLIAINAAAVLLLLGFTGTWTASLVATGLLAVLLYTVGPELLRSLRWQQAPHAAGVLLRHSSVAGGQGLERQLSRMSRTAAGVPAGGAEGPSLGGYRVVHDSGDGEAESDEVEDLEDSIPYSEDFDEWPDAPVMLCPDPAASQQEFVVEGPGPCHALSVNGDPIPFETPLFKGVVAVYIRHLNTTPLHLFKGKKRLAWVALQGTFKAPVSMDHLVYGMEFSRQLSNLPAPWFLENMLLPLARKISPSLRVGTLEDPFFLSPIITASQVVNVSLPGEAPPLMEAKEDTRLLHQELGGKAGDGLTVASRRKYFQTASNRHMPFNTDYVWTFHLWQEYIDYASYMLNLGYSSYDLTQHLDGQPLQVMAKDESTGQQLISLHVWHANLVRCLAPHRMPRRARVSRLSNVSHDDTPMDRSTNVTGGGAEPDTAAAALAAAAAPVSPTAAAQHSNAPEQHTAAQQEQQHHSSPLPMLDTELQKQQQQVQQQQQQQDSVQQQDSPVQQQRQQDDMLRHHQQAPHLLQTQPRQQQQQQHYQQPASPPSRPSQQQQQQQQEQQQQQPQDLSALPSTIRPVSRGHSSVAMQLQQQQQHGPTPSSLSESRLQRPAGLQDYRDSGSSMSDPDGAAGAAAAQSLQQLPALRPAASPVLHQQLSLPVQQQQSQQQGQAEGLTIAELQSLSAAGSSGLVVVGSGAHSAAAANRAQTPSSQSDSWVAASRAFGEGRPARFSAAADVMSSEGADSPLACRTPGHPSSSSSSGQQQQQQQQSTPPSSSKKKKKKDPRDKEEQQRQQLHGLSVMGAL